MADPKFLLRIAANVAELRANLAEGKDQIEVTAAAMTKLSSSLQGDKIIAQAHAMVGAVQQVGDVTKLTEAEKAKLNRTLQEAIAKYQAVGRDAPKAMIDLEAATRRVEAPTQGLSAKMVAFGAAIGTMAANALMALGNLAVQGVKNLAGGIVDLVSRGAQISGVSSAFQALASSLGETGSVMLGSVRTATRGMISDFDIMAASNKAMLLGLPVSSAEMGKLAASAVVLGRAMKQDAGKSLDDLVTALGRSSPLILDNLGLTVKVGEANEAYAAKLGKSVTALTDAEKKTAFYHAAVDLASRKVEELGGIQLTFGDRLQIVRIGLGNVTDALALAIAQSPTLNALIEKLGNALLTAFGANQEAAVSGITSQVDRLALRLIDMGQGALTVAGVIRQGWAVLELVFSSTASVIYSVGLAMTTLIANAAEMGSVIPGSGAMFAEVGVKAREAETKIRGMQQSFHDQAAEALEAVKGNGSFQQTLDGLSGTLSETKQAMVTATTETRQATATTNTAKTATDAFAETTKKLKESIQELASKLQLAHVQGAPLNAVLDQFGKEAVKAVAEAKVLGVAVPKALQDIAAAFQQSELDKLMEKATREWLKNLDTFNNESIKKLHAFNDARAKGILSNLAIVTAAEKDAAQARNDIWLDGITKTLVDIKRAHDEMRRNVDATVPGHEAAWQRIKEAERVAMDAAMAHYEDSLNDGFKGTLTFSDRVSDVFANLGTDIGTFLQQAFTGGGGIMGAIQGLATKIGSGIGGAVGGIFGPMGSQIGSAIGSMLGPLIGKIKDLFSKPEWKKVAEDVGRDMGLSLSEGLSKAIADSSKEIGDRVAATLLHLPEIAKEAGGITTANVAMFTQETRDLFSQVERGLLSIGQASAVASEMLPQLAAVAISGNDQVFESFRSLIDVVKAFGGDLSSLHPMLVELAGQVGTMTDQEFARFVTLLETTGTDIEGLAEAIDGQIGPAVDGMIQAISGGAAVMSRSMIDLAMSSDQAGKFMAAASDLASRGFGQLISNMQVTEQNAGRVAASVGAIFQGALASGIPVNQLFASMGPALQALEQRYKDLGLEGSASFQAIHQIAAIANNEIANNAVAAAQGATQAMVGLHSQGLLTQDMFTLLGSEVFASFKAMEAQGLGGTQALQRMQPELQTIWQLQHDFGLVVDEGTQQLLDQAVAAGIVGEAHKTEGQKSLDALQLIVDRLGVLIGLLGGEVPAALGTMAGAAIDEAAAAGDALATEIGDTLTDLGVQADTDMPLSFEEMELAAQAAALQIKTALDEELISGALPDLDDALVNVGNVGRKQFVDVIGNAAGQAAGAVIDIGNAAYDAAQDVRNAADDMVKSWKTAQTAAETAAGNSPTGVELITYRVFELADALEAVAPGIESSFDSWRERAERMSEAVGEARDGWERFEREREGREREDKEDGGGASVSGGAAATVQHQIATLQHLINTGANAHVGGLMLRLLESGQFGDLTAALPDLAKVQEAARTLIGAEIQARIEAATSDLATTLQLLSLTTDAAQAASLQQRVKELELRIHTLTEQSQHIPVLDNPRGSLVTGPTVAALAMNGRPEVVLPATDFSAIVGELKELRAEQRSLRRDFQALPRQMGIAVSEAVLLSGGRR